MIDRFKYRAWDKKRKRMYEVLHLHTGTYNNGGDWATVKGFNIITQQDVHIQVQPKDCILMQCTGLKDKNGKLIYDKDLIRYNKNVFRVNINLLNMSLTNILNGHLIVVDDSKIFNDSEVIGNEFECNTKI